MIHKLRLAPVVTVTALSLALAACGSQAPAQPLLDDPREILTESIVALKDVKSVEFTTALSGSIDLAELGGEFDLSSVTLAGAFDVDGQKLKLTLDAPTLMGTKIELLTVDGFAYVRASGLIGGMLGGDAAGKWLKSPVEDSPADAVDDPAEIDEAIDEVRAGLSLLPQPVLHDAERCGDVDCYHVSLVVSEAQLESFDPTGGVAGDTTIDLYTRQTDRRPAKIVLSATSADVGDMSITINLAYDVSVSVDAPPAEDVVEE